MEAAVDCCYDGNNLFAIEQISIVYTYGVEAEVDGRADTFRVVGPGLVHFWVDPPTSVIHTHLRGVGWGRRESCILGN